MLLFLHRSNCSGTWYRSGAYDVTLLDADTGLKIVKWLYWTVNSESQPGCWSMGSKVRGQSGDGVWWCLQTWTSASRAVTSVPGRRCTAWTSPALICVSVEMASRWITLSESVKVGTACHYYTHAIARQICSTPTEPPDPSQDLTILSLWHIRKFLAKVNCASNFRKKTCASDFHNCTMTHLKVETRKLQVKSGVSWALLYFECRFNLTTTTTTTFFVIFNVKSYFQLLCTVLRQWNSSQ